MKLFDTIKNILTSSPARDFNFICVSCGLVFDGIEVEMFIKHQITEKHYNAKKVLK